MKTFLLENIRVVWFFSVILSTVILFYTIRFGLNFLEKKLKKGEDFTYVFSSLQKISKVFLTIFCIGLLSYLFFEKSMYNVINNSLGMVIWIGIVFTVTIVTAAFANDFFKSKVDQLSKREQGDVTTYKYLNYLIVFSIYFIGVVLVALAIPSLRKFSAAASAGAGVFALIAGVAAQEGISNLIGGLFIAFFKPFRIGDVIKIGNDIVGHVEDINLRHTVIKNFQNKRVIIPNASINKENIVNYYLRDPKVCQWIEIGISYDSDVEKALQILQEECEKHPFALDMRTREEKDNNTVPKVDVQVINLNDSSVDLRAWVWCATYMTSFKMKNELYKIVKLRFDAEGIEIPYPHRTLVMKSNDNFSVN